MSEKSRADAGHSLQCAGVGTVDSVDKILEGIECVQRAGELVPRHVTFNDNVKPPRHASRHTMDPNKLYLDSCATYNSMFIDWALGNISPSKVHLKGHCNAGVLTCTHQGYYGPFKMWLNNQGIVNLLSIPQLEEDGYKVE